MVGCGSTKKADPYARQACVYAAGDRAAAATVEAAYLSGRLGTATTVRKQVSNLGHQAGFTVSSFVRPNGSLIPWARMSADQQQTFKKWQISTPSVAKTIGEEATDASRKASARAKSTCS